MKQAKRWSDRGVHQSVFGVSTCQEASVPQPMITDTVSQDSALAARWALGRKREAQRSEGEGS